MTEKYIAAEEKKNIIHKAKAETHDQEPHSSGIEKAGLVTFQRHIGNGAVHRALAQRFTVMRKDGSKPPVSDVEATKVDSSKKLSGAGWVSEFPTSNTVSDLDSTFGGNVQTFIDALKVAGATVKINATKRPAERAYLMHWAWKIAKTNHDASKVPAKAGVNINWWHGNQTDSKKAAQEMVDKYEIDNLKVAPSLYGRHIYGKAIDMEISWGGDLKIRAAGGIERIIKSSPKDNTNPDLIAVGKTYGVVHFTNVDKDKVHWSTDGH